MTNCMYCTDEKLDEFDVQADDKWYNSIGYCDNCNRWFGIQMCQHCKDEGITEITDLEIITDFIRDYIEE